MGMKRCQDSENDTWIRLIRFMYDAVALAKRMISRYFKTDLIYLYLKAKVDVQRYNQT